MRSLPTAEQVWECLKSGATTAQAARVTGWPPHAVRTLVERTPGWLIDSSGRAVRIPCDGPGSRPPRRIEILTAALEERHDRHALTWGEIASQLGLHVSTLDQARRGIASLRVCQLIEAWLARPVLAPLPEVVEQRELHAALRARKIQLHTTWRWVASDAGVSLAALRTVRRGKPSTPRVRGALLAWLERTAPAAGREDIRDTG